MPNKIGRIIRIDNVIKTGTIIKTDTVIRTGMTINPDDAEEIDAITRCRIATIRPENEAIGTDATDGKELLRDVMQAATIEDVI
jgi:hypothetical protein